MSFQSNSKDWANLSTRFTYIVLNGRKAFIIVKQTDRNIPTTELYIANVILSRKSLSVACAAAILPGSIAFSAGKPLLIPGKVPKIPPIIIRLGNLEKTLLIRPSEMKPHSLLE